MISSLSMSSAGPLLRLPTPLPSTPRNVPDPDPTQFMSLTPAYSMALIPSQYRWPLAHIPDTPYACPWPVVHILLICWSRPLPLSFRSEHVPQMKPTINGHHHYISTSNEVERRKKGKNVVGCKIPCFSLIVNGGKNGSIFSCCCWQWDRGEWGICMGTSAGVYMNVCGCAG